MGDIHHFKDKYNGTWKLSAEKEEFISNIITEKTGFNVINYGLGSGETEYIEGNAESNGKEKSIPDLYIEDVDCYVEVTGPFIPLDITATLWVRPDKIERSMQMIEAKNGRNHVVAHVLVDHITNNNVVRIINLNKDFLNRYKKGEIPIELKNIYGSLENMAEIEHNDSCVITMDDFISRITYDPNEDLKTRKIDNIMERKEVLEAIDSERDYQDNAIKGGGTHIVKEFPLGSALSAIQVKLEIARNCWYGGVTPHQIAMEEIRKIAAICVQMGEQYGMPKR